MELAKPSTKRRRSREGSNTPNIVMFGKTKRLLNRATIYIYREYTGLTERRGKTRFMIDKKRAEEYIDLTCPSCGRKSRIPQTSGTPSRCQYCGKDWYTSKIEVQSKESRKLQKELEKARKIEIDADRNRE